MELAFEYTYEVDVNWKIYVENGLEGYHVAVVHDVLNDFVETRNARHFFEEHGELHARLHQARVSRDDPEPAAPLAPRSTPTCASATSSRTSSRCSAPAEFSYLRIDPVGPERIRLMARSFDLGGDLAALRDFRRDALDRTNQQDIGVVTRVQRGLHARGYRGGVHSSFLECRIGHFERMVSRALAPDSAWKSLKREGSWTYEDSQAARPARAGAGASRTGTEAASA